MGKIKEGTICILLQYGAAICVFFITLKNVSPNIYTFLNAFSGKMLYYYGQLLKL